jgi:hypothetical protein
MKPVVLAFVVLAGVLSVGASGLAGGQAARAEGLPPRYDTDGLCFRNANSTNGFAPEAVTSCVASQSNALNRLRRMWDALPAALADDCDERTRATGRQDYIALENCLKVQMSQNGAVPLVPLPTVPRTRKDEAAPQ